MLNRGNTHTVTIHVVDRGSNHGLAAEVWLDGGFTHTNRDGMATFEGVRAGNLPVSIIADPEYPIVNWRIRVPQVVSAIFRLEKRA